MSTVVLERGEVDVSVEPEHREDVILQAVDPDSRVRGDVHLLLTPGQAVELSRALVAAAAKALRVEV